MNGEIYIRQYCPTCRLYRPHAVVEPGAATVHDGPLLRCRDCGTLAPVLPLGGSSAPEPPPSITCPRCGFTSYHPRDIAERYCGMCHVFHGDEP